MRSIVKHIILFLILIFCLQSSVFSDTETDKLLKSLDESIAKRDYYIQIKLQRINQLIDSVNIARNNHDTYELYTLYDQLHDEYKSYTYDSAFKYVMELNRT